MTNQEAIEILNAYNQRLDDSCSNLLDYDKEAFDLAIKALEERPKGKWLEDKNAEYGWKCSECGDNRHRASSFCPNCGARMER